MILSVISEHIMVHYNYYNYNCFDRYLIPSVFLQMLKTMKIEKYMGAQCTHYYIFLQLFICKLIKVLPHLLNSFERKLYSCIDKQKAESDACVFTSKTFFHTKIGNQQ